MGGEWAEQRKLWIGRMERELCTIIARIEREMCIHYSQLYLCNE